MSRFIIPRPNCSSLPRVVGGDGVHLIDEDGKRYLDGCGGAAVSCLGHSNTAVATAIRQQLDEVAYAHTRFFTSAAAETLAEKLAAISPGELNRVYFTCGGSEAIEAALKLARQYHVVRGEPQRRYVIGRQQSYHGNTMGALAVGDNYQRRSLYAPLLFESAHHIAPCHYWRLGEEGESVEDYGRRAAQQLEDKIQELGADSVIAFIAETVVGATLGVVAAAGDYFRHIREICDRHGVLLILDEVMCGMGRTGALFACEQEGVVPDIVCVAKGLGAGYQPLGALLSDEKIYATIADNSAGFQHGHTYLGHATACAAGVAVLAEIERQGLMAAVNERGKQLRDGLRNRLGDHPHIGDIRGRGLFWGIEFVAEGKTPFPAGEQIHEKIRKASLERGLMVYSMGGGADGKSGDHILLAPPYIISESEVEELADKLTTAITDILGV